MSRGTPLLIVGAGGLGRETLAAVRAVNAVAPRWDVLGFADDAPGLRGTLVDGVPVLGAIDEVESRVQRGDDVEVVIATGRPGGTWSRTRLGGRLGQAGARFATVVHPAAALAAGTEVGEGSIVLAGVVTTAPMRIGAHVVAMPHVVLTHDDEVGDAAMLAARASLAGNVTVEDGAYLGAGCLVREGLTIGSHALVGMGAVVTHDVPAGEVWVGNPARRLEARVPADR